MTYLSDLEDARDNIATQLKDMTASPKPTYNIDGQMVDWDKHFSALNSQLQILNKSIQRSAEPFEVRSIGYT